MARNCSFIRCRPKLPAAIITGRSVKAFCSRVAGIRAEKIPTKLPLRLCQVNRIHSEISVNCRWLLYAISMA